MLPWNFLCKRNEYKKFELNASQQFQSNLGIQILMYIEIFFIFSVRFAKKEKESVHFRFSLNCINFMVLALLFVSPFFPLYSRKCYGQMNECLQILSRKKKTLDSTPQTNHYRHHPFNASVLTEKARHIKHHMIGYKICKQPNLFNRRPISVWCSSSIKTHPFHFQFWHYYNNINTIVCAGLYVKNVTLCCIFQLSAVTAAIVYYIYGLSRSMSAGYRDYHCASAAQSRLIAFVDWMVCV